MKLDTYNVTITISDPDSPGTKASFTMARCPREKLVDLKLIGPAIKTFEEAIEDRP
jgi:hypothetical protein